MTERTVTLPDLGEGLTESDLVEWLVAPGDRVELNQVVAEVETAKALVQLPSPCAGVVAALLAEPGTTVPVGGPLLTITADEPSPAAAPPAASPARTAVLVGYGPPVEGARRPRRRERSSAWLATHVVADAPPTPHDSPSTTRPVINPLVRKLAHDLGVHLERVAASGTDGTITRDDVLRAVSPGRAGLVAVADRTTTVGSATASPPESVPVHGSGPAGPPPPQPVPTAPKAADDPRASQPDAAADVRVAVTGVRKQTAAAMVASAFTAPHASVHLTVDVTPTLGLLAELRADPAYAESHVTLLALVAKALTVAVGRSPELNAHWDEASGEILRYGHVGLGIAVDSPRGLVVPVVHDAERLRLPDLARALRDLTETARAGATAPADLAGGTITITNVGVLGVDGGTPILVPGQAAILATGAVRRRPWEHEDQVALRSVMTTTLSFDHRVVDGAEAARFLADVGAVLARPGAVLAMV
ncbi:dihydrolipoamide acetyltransferase family protein [Cellulomonas alba]|uniref:Dihydrolipoamide acetyltransferase component of pyruvate dehydrogenase complex n=1 Tax=Cellulomonas alba TaxID=3053467 RepID=A0ABT7SJB9_9CELL|nr:dihydrolipoamide acetyltransferase family protein [Cellulomonas alba]MDM7856282.1 dihydrolipoamide acetyltransferase family protein [Cellulomonas alba]